MTFPRHARTVASEPVIPGGQPELCDVCGALVHNGSEQYATVADSSAVHPTSSRLDGRRRLTACGRAHLHELISRYTDRPYDEDELLGRIVLRAKHRIGHEATLDDLAFVTGFTIAQVMRAERWSSIWLTWLPEAADV